MRLEKDRAYRLLPKDGLVSKDFVVCVWMALATYFANAMFIEIRQFEYMNVLLFFLMGMMMGAVERVERGGQVIQSSSSSVPIPAHLAAPPVR